MCRKCYQCGQEVGQEDVYCTNCGSLLIQNKNENEDIEKQSAFSKLGMYDPLSLGDYMFIGLILMIPVVNIVFLLIWALDSHGNLNRRNLAKAGLIYFGIGIALTVILGIGLVRAVMLDQLVYPGGQTYDYKIEHPDFDDWIDLPYKADET
ncbi:hypothetical protein CLNEO_26140 [Anaerotignum neopropionicum]|uniref:Zinc-ribbon domain-containing protein n=1 Tax=Anaerotignum neopropionicum TaxID=36847 RepID=A0A136WBP4_9FIRM|nr:hypothetical protein CLNEO_26140 [Anaerotignum neopropionicum]